MSGMDSLNREVNPAKLGKAVAGIFALCLAAALVFKGIPAGLRLRAEYQAKERIRKALATSAATPTAAAEKLVTRTFQQDAGGRRVFGKSVELTRLAVTNSVQSTVTPTDWIVAGIGLAKADAGSTSIPFQWNVTVQWNAKEKLWYSHSYRFTWK